MKTKDGSALFDAQPRPVPSRVDNRAVRTRANKKLLLVPAGRLNAPCSGFLGRLDGHHHEAWDCSGVPLLPSGGRRFLKERRPAHTTAIVGCWGEDALYLHSAFSQETSSII